MTSHPIDEPLDMWTSAALTATGEDPPAVDELVRLLARLTARHPGVWEMTQVGRSRRGEPLHLVTVRGGPLRVLVIAGVHPNENIGACTVAALAHLLHEHPHAFPQVTWHLMPCLDPDGARLNTWTRYSGPPTLASYHRGLYRPAHADQPEWMLPRAGGRAPLPEAAAIAHVIDTRRPDLVASLHNCDTGGAFLLAAQGHPLLAPVLTRAANRSRIPIADHPSDALDWPSSGHGTFTIPPPDQIRPAPPGTSSIHYAHELGARYALMPEVPMWASRPHALPADQAARQLEDAAAILTRLTQQAELPTDGPFGAALADALRGMPLTAGVYRAHPDAGAGQDLAYLLPLRASGMLLRTLDPLLASGAGRLDAVRALTEEYFRQWLDAAEAALCPEPLPLHRTAGLQLDVILGALALLGEQGPQQALAAETGATRHHPVAHAPAVPANALASSAPLSPSPEEHPVTHSGTDYNRPGQRRIGCLALIRNTGGDVLLVKPSYKEGHILVGGGAQPDEEPHHAAYREAVEETGLTQLTIDGLLLVDYIPANPTSGSVEGYNLVFDAGVITDDAAITLPAGLPGQQPELTDWVFCPPDQLDTYCEPYQARRITQALAALDYPSRRGLCIEGFPANVN